MLMQRAPRARPSAGHLRTLSKDEKLTRLQSCRVLPKLWNAAPGSPHHHTCVAAEMGQPPDASTVRGPMPAAVQPVGLAWNPGCASRPLWQFPMIDVSTSAAWAPFSRADIVTLTHPFPAREGGEVSAAQPEGAHGLTQRGVPPLQLVGHPLSKLEVGATLARPSHLWVRVRAGGWV